ncbi:LysE family translocator [Rhodospirillum rubrum]|uniref:Conserved hypothetical transmembrane protein n=1 Tax=Rhodospirillum rubrum (strain ATCC 11170 / ATH 1.1.1 / DSM 467 / LMG 4362 / NCIMB 8255 / S1) TaxID=269796 RepID=Q2RMU2_RHORT|nr:LysE family translocator [Rhodospirillum rubrum]ABC24553.1 conserved hypothetical transmembrane protein [Rhodospirillum rubrum ATCC 11170]AEO50306.1 hypothetical protein F11_19230 [Rhodospirillum rubrum F11]MBK5956285.1 LysE family translocator [Rhodospirillum rubrum]QXG80468.1 LysE family translocator [Rhodospirillum rubrum]
MSESLLPLVLFAVTMFFTPGPNNVMLTTSGAAFGFRRTFPHLLGVALGFPLMFVAVGLGLGAAFTAIPGLQRLIALIGGCYLLYLAWRIATLPTTAPATDAAGEGKKAKARARPLGFLQAAAFQWANPKGWVIVISALATFTSPSSLDAGDQRLAQILVIVVVFIAVGLASSAA